MRNLSQIEVLSLADGNQEIIDLIIKSGCLKGDGHFRLTSGIDSSYYFDKGEFLSEQSRFERICQLLYENIKKMSRLNEIAMLAGPETWGSRIAFGVREAAARDDRRFDVVETRRINGQHSIPDNLVCLVRDKSFIMIDDVWTSGHTLDELSRLLVNNGGYSAGCFVLVNRSASNLKLNNKVSNRLSSLNALVKLRLPAWDSTLNECPLCIQGIPLNTELGHGRFVTNKEQLAIANS